VAGKSGTAGKIVASRADYNVVVGFSRKPVLTAIVVVGTPRAELRGQRRGAGHAASPTRRCVTRAWRRLCSRRRRARRPQGAAERGDAGPTVITAAPWTTATACPTARQAPEGARRSPAGA
jgi:hypothetical protein